MVDSFVKFDRVDDWVNLLGTFLCVCLAALAAGLTMGIVSLESVDLRVKMRTGNAKERRWARRLLPLVDLVPHHQVLVTLLLVNSLANEALPLFLDALVPSWCAIVASVTVVLFVGELIPSAIFTGPAKLHMAAKCAPLASAFLFVASPVAYPLAVVLDRVMPEEPTHTTRDEVAALVEIERDLALEAGNEAPFSADAVDIVGGTMGLHKLTVRDCMCDKIFSIPSTATASKDQLRSLADAGYSRVPIKDHYHHHRGGEGENDDDAQAQQENNNGSLRRYLLVKELVGLDADPTTLLTSVSRAVREPLWTGPDAGLFALLNEFQTGTSHIAFVSKNPKVARAICAQASASGSSSSEKRLPPEASVVGIITLEDIMETIIQEEIYDEADRHVAARRIANFFLRLGRGGQKKKHRKTPSISRRPKPSLSGKVPRSTLLAVAQQRRNDPSPTKATPSSGGRRVLLKRAASERERRGERHARVTQPGERDALLSASMDPPFHNSFSYQEDTDEGAMDEPMSSPSSSIGDLV
mmetsp:Transcript_29602/g.95455  ORF Transcript_29602/g.95455 Transcript_29602/m.95455 type:complete len:527 (-) Transcript_29602:27-1607(-)